MGQYDHAASGWSPGRQCRGVVIVEFKPKLWAGSTQSSALASTFSSSVTKALASMTGFSLIA